LGRMDFLPERKKVAFGLIALKIRKKCKESDQGSRREGRSKKKIEKKEAHS